jgi:hypothetical protein
MKKLGINPSPRTPTAWDHFFEQEQEAFVRATLKDGRVIGGYYGPGSFATYGEEGRDLFISSQWELDGDAWFTHAVDASLGVWVPKESIVSFEVYAVKRDDGGEKEATEANTASTSGTGREERGLPAEGNGPGPIEPSGS